MKELIGALIVVATVLFGCTGVLVAVAFTTQKSRLEILKTLGGMSLGRDRFIGIAQLWANLFQRVFGQTYLARRQLISIPLYTLLVSLVFFVVWLLDLYLFKNPEHVFNVPPPPNVLQAIQDFYGKGLLVAMVIDCVTIQLTKWSINVGTRRGFGSWQFLGCFSATIALAYLLFSVAVYWFRWSDMNELYAMLPVAQCAVFDRAVSARDVYLCHLRRLYLQLFHARADPVLLRGDRNPLAAHHRRGLSIRPRRGAVATVVHGLCQPRRHAPDQRHECGVHDAAGAGVGAVVPDGALSGCLKIRPVPSEALVQQGRQSQLFDKAGR